MISISYYRARYYDSQIGRFISEDPIRSGLDFYLYGDNNPSIFVDPLGLQTCTKTPLGLVCSGKTDPVKEKQVMINALNRKNLSCCLRRLFGPGVSLTLNNLPHINATEDLPGATAGRVRAEFVPERGRATVQIDRGNFTGMSSDDPFLVLTYLHEVANALAIQRFKDVFPRNARAWRGPLGGPPTADQKKLAATQGDSDIGNQFEKCLAEH